MPDTLAADLSPEQRDVFAEIAHQVLESLQQWLDFFEDPKFHSVPFIVLFLDLFAEPGQKKSDLILALQTRTRISHSTAQRMLKDAEEAGYLVVSERVGERGLATELSEALHEHCVAYLSGRTRKALSNLDVLDTLELGEE